MQRAFGSLQNEPNRQSFFTVAADTRDLRTSAANVVAILPGTARASRYSLASRELHVDLPVAFLLYSGYATHQVTGAISEQRQTPTNNIRCLARPRFPAPMCQNFPLSVALFSALKLRHTDVGWGVRGSSLRGLI